MKYYYQRDILHGACVTEQDPPEEVARKVQVLWNAYEEELVCNVMSFDVINGNLIRLGVSHRFDPFINDVLKWGVNLNRIDQDNKTELDYIQEQREKFKGTSVEARLNRYYQRFQAAGAKHRSELPK